MQAYHGVWGLHPTPQPNKMLAQLSQYRLTAKCLPCRTAQLAACTGAACHCLLLAHRAAPVEEERYRAAQNWTPGAKARSGQLGTWTKTRAPA
jgi:hypothetical protein